MTWLIIIVLVRAFIRTGKNTEQIYIKNIANEHSENMNKFKYEAYSESKYRLRIFPPQR
jgi:hypothetical protein